MAAVYRFKVTFEEYEDVVRVIDIKSTQTFLDFHHAILSAIGFDSKQLASFYMSNDTWKKGEEITLEDMTEDPENPIKTMANCKLSQFVDDPHQKILYVYDFIECWTFYIELTGIVKEEKDKKYPFLSKSIGLAPKQYDKVQKFGMIEDDEFEEIAKKYLNVSDEEGGEISDEEADEFGLFDNGEGGEDGVDDDRF
ncbi:MAG: IS1096 element passenger TnpR family protein [Bacteroidia bacterium]